MLKARRQICLLNINDIYIIKAGVCLFVCLSLFKCTNVTRPLVFKLLDGQDYLWLSYDQAEVIKLIGLTMSFLLH